MEDTNSMIDELELAMTEFEPVNCPLIHRFTDGLYIRQIFMPKSEDGKETWITTMVHNTTHPFFVMKGRVKVFSDNDGAQIIEAPYFGITTPNTRRVLLIEEDTIWITLHPTNIQPKDNSDEAINEAVKLVSKQILKEYENPLLGGHYVNNSFVPDNKEINY